MSIQREKPEKSSEGEYFKLKNKIAKLLKKKKQSRQCPACCSKKTVKRTAKRWLESKLPHVY